MTKKRFYRSLLLFTTPILINAATYTWDSTSSSDLNTAGNWSPNSGPPGVSDNAEFNSATPGVVTFPSTLTGSGFSIYTIDFLNNAEVFQFLINNGTLTFGGGGIGSAIPNSLTNTTISINNVDNSSPLANQIVFNGDPSTSGSSTLTVLNSGTTTSGTSSSAQISVITGPGYQLYSPHFFTAKDDATFIASNTGTNHFNASSLEVAFTANTQLQFDNILNGTNVNNITLNASNSGTNSGTGDTNSVGYVGNPQINIVQNFLAGNNLTLTTSNIGEESSTGNGSNYVGYVGDSQIELDHSWIVQNYTTLEMSNIGTITSDASNVSCNNNQVGVISGDQLDQGFNGGSFFGGDFLTFSATNTGTNSGSGSGSTGPTNPNLTGVIQGVQYYFRNGFSSGNNTTITTFNTGTVNGSGSYNQTGVVYSNPFFVGSTFRTGSNATITVSNTGTNTGSGNNNLIGESQGAQFFLGDNSIFGDHTTITVSNTGTDSGSGNTNSVGYISSGQQLYSIGNFTSGNYTNISISNTGTYSSSGSGNNFVGGLVTDQFTCNEIVTLGDNATFTISNSGTSNGSGISNNQNMIGCTNNQNQITTNGFVAGNNLNFTVTNTGVDSSSGNTNSIGVVSYQCSHNRAFTTQDNATITVSNTGTMNGNGTSHNVGSNGSGQFTVADFFQAGNYLTLTTTNIGTNNTTIGSTNNIATNYGQQILVDSTFTVGDNASITLLNKGINSNNAALGNVGVLSGQDQFHAGNIFSSGENLLLSATNSAEGVPSGGFVGSCQNQLYFNGICTIDNGSIISAFNEGFGTVTGSQISLQQGFVITSGKATIQASNSTEGSIAEDGIFIAGSSSGGNAEIILENTSLNISSSAPSFTIGALNGDSLSTVESTPNLIINTDSDVVGAFAGNTLTAPSLTKSGKGTQALSGVIGTSINTTVEEGTLILDGFLTGNMDVGSNGAVKGVGALSGTLTIDGTIAPGNSIGTLFTTIYVQNSGSQYEVEVNGAGESDLIDVFGATTINGGTVVASSSDGTYKFQNPYTILETGTRTGVYSGVSAVSSMITPKITYDPQHVYLTLFANIASAANTFNELAVANQLDQIVNPTPLQNTLLSEIANLSVPEARKALDSVSGWQYTNQTLMAENVNSQFLTRLYDPIRLIVTSNEKCCYCTPCTNDLHCCNDWTAWTEFGGTLTKIDGNHNAFAVSFNGWEATMGLQKTFLCDWTIGLAGSFEQDFINYKHSGGSGRSNTCLAGLYALYRPSHFYTFIDFAYGYSFNQMNRSVYVGPLSYEGKSHPNVSQFTFYGELGVDLKANAVFIQPFIGVEAGSYWRNGIKESNVGGWELQVEKSNNGLASTRLGMHLTVGKPSGNIGLASFDLSWDKRWTSAYTTITEEFVNFGDDFIIKGVDFDSNSVYYALTLAKCVNKNWRLHAKGEGNIWYHAYQFDALFGVEYSW